MLKIIVFNDEMDTRIKSSLLYRVLVIISKIVQAKQILEV